MGIPGVPRAAIAAPALLLLAAARAPTNHAPTVTIEFPDGAVANVLSEVRVRVTIDDADGDRVSARLVAGPQTLVMRPVVDELPPVTRELRWLATTSEGGRQHVAVAARDAAAATARGEASLDLLAASHGDTFAFLDVDGDARPEVVVADPGFDATGVTDAGALLVFDPRAPPASGPWTPAAVLRSGTPTPFARLGDRGPGGAQRLQQVDLDGDGRRDLVAVSEEAGGTVHVWFGGRPLAGGRAEDARLVAPPNANLAKTMLGAQWLLFHDVTGDGVEDVVCAAPRDSALLRDSGAIHLFAGGSGLAGAVAPTATLRLANAVRDDRLGQWTDGTSAARQCVRFHDVTGDGIDDVIGVAPFADLNGVHDSGVIGVWAGGAGLVGVVTPLATLASAHRLVGGGRWEDWTPVAFGDLDADGVDDLVAAAAHAASLDGRIVVWKGGATLAGSPAPLAELDAGPGAGSYANLLGDDFFRVLDFTGDGIPDVLASSRGADVGGVEDAGGCCLFAGRAGLAGPTLPDALLADATGETRGMVFQWSALADVTGDGIRDLVLVTPELDTPAGIDTGVVHVWRGGVPWSGRPTATARLTVPDAQPFERLGQNHALVKCRFADVTGDGVLDLVLPTVEADRGDAHRDCGAIHVFAGGASLSGAVAPRASLLTPRRAPSDRLGADARDFRFEDVTGDGIADVVTGCAGFSATAMPRIWPPGGFGLASGGPPAPSADAGEGGVFVWRGGATLAGEPAPAVVLHGRSAGEALHALDCADVNGDGVLDVLAGSPDATVRGTLRAGRGYVLAGGANLAAVPPWSLERAAPWLADGLFESGDESGHPWLCADLDGDGRDDLVARAPYARVGHSGDVGVLLCFPAGVAPAGGALEWVCGALDRDHLFGW